MGRNPEARRRGHARPSHMANAAARESFSGSPLAAVAAGTSAVGIHEGVAEAALYGEPLPECHMERRVHLNASLGNPRSASALTTSALSNNRTNRSMVSSAEACSLAR
jgi:hypothetical protein